MNRNAMHCGEYNGKYTNMNKLTTRSKNVIKRCK